MRNSIELLKDIVDNIETVIIGKRSVIELVLLTLISKGHILIEDIPGVGKTSLAGALARSVDCSFKRIQFTSDILPSDITGFSIYNQRIGDFEFKQGAVMSQFVLADEINRTSPKTQASLLEVMEENQVTVDGTTYPVPQPFMVMATQNPIEYLGTFPLPEAQLDRFFMKISMGYPAPAQESAMLSRFKTESPLETMQPAASSEDILIIQDEVRDIYVHKALNDYIISIILATRNHPKVLLGASPRASLNLYRAAQAKALYSGRDYVLPSDIQEMASPVLSHRLILKQEFKIEKISNETIVEEIIKRTSVPVLKTNA